MKRFEFISVAWHAMLAILVISCPESSIAGTTYTAKDCTLAEVQTKVNAAANGDTVFVPGGECTWGSTLTIPHPIKLAGAGAGLGGTKITHAGGPYPMMSGITSYEGGLLDISGFWFTGGSLDTSVNSFFHIGNTTFRIHANRLDATGVKMMVIANFPLNKNYSYGVVDSNVFRGSGTYPNYVGQGPNIWGFSRRGGTLDEWKEDRVFGDNNFVFFENNTFDTVFMANDGFAGAKFVFRYNNFTYFYPAAIQGHDAIRNGYPSPAAWEIYNNKFTTHPNHTWVSIEMAGGTGVIHHNEFIGPSGMNTIFKDGRSSNGLCNGSASMDQNMPGETGWRCEYQIGTNFCGDNVTNNNCSRAAITVPVYIWGNTGQDGASKGVNCAGVSAGAGTHIQENRDFFCNTPRPGYRPYTCPHPLTGLTGACDFAIAGTAGYNVGAQPSLAPMYPVIDMVK